MNGDTQTVQFKRKTIIVKKKLQYIFVLLVLASLLLGVVLVLTDLGLTLHRIQETSPALIEKLIVEITPFLPTIALKMIIYISIIFVVALVFSHRIAGPLYKIEISARRIGKGDLSYEVYYRKGDQLNSLRHAFNAMIKALKDIVIDDRKAAAEIATQLSEIALKTQDKELARKLNELSDKTSTITKRFKL